MRPHLIDLFKDVTLHWHECTLSLRHMKCFDRVDVCDIVLGEDDFELPGNVSLYNIKLCYAFEKKDRCPEGELRQLYVRIYGKQFL